MNRKELLMVWKSDAHEEYNNIRHRKVEPSGSDARENEDPNRVLVVVELPYELVSLFKRDLAIDGNALNPIEA
jgi:hypothetical protein